MPFIAHSRKATTDLVGELLAEFARPLSYSFVADDDTPSGQQFLHHAQTEWEAEIQPHGMADDLGREPLPAVTGVSGRRHPSRLLTPASPRKRGKPAKLTVPAGQCSRDLGRRKPISFGEDGVDADNERVPLGDTADEFGYQVPRPRPLPVLSEALLVN